MSNLTTSPAWQALVQHQQAMTAVHMRDLFAGDNGRFSRFLRLNTLPPRDQIRYFYLATLKRAGQRGVVRSSHQTPNEYAAYLKDHWPDAEADIDHLTTAFLHAQYNPAPIEPERLPLHKAAWQRLKRLLRRQTRNQP